MGFLSRFTGKEEHDLRKLDQVKSQIAMSFSNLKKDVDNQNKWINYLHQSSQGLSKAHREITNLHHTLKSSHESHKSKTEADLKHMNKWVDYLHSSNQILSGRVKNLEDNITKAFTLYNQNIKDLYQLIKNHPKVDEEILKQKIMKEVKLMVETELIKETKARKKDLEEIHTPAHSLSAMHPVLPLEFNHAQPAEKQIFHSVQKPVQGYTPDLSSPEKKLINFLFNQSEPSSYAQIAAKTGHSINTVRVNMNLLKRKNLVEENMLPSGVKLFTITNKERIKKVYNLHVL